MDSLAILLLVVLLCYAQNKDMLEVLQLLFPAISAWITAPLASTSELELLSEQREKRFKLPLLRHKEEREKTAL